MVLHGLRRFSVHAFTANAAGRQARQIADRSPEYVFPQKGTDPVGLGALRQSVMLDMRHGYSSNNPLGLWIHVWISYTNKALTTAEGRKMMNELAERNGRDLDSKAIIATASEIDDLHSKGFIKKTLRPVGDPLRYAICPVVKDPRDGGIAEDQFLAYDPEARRNSARAGVLSELSEPADHGRISRLAFREHRQRFVL